MMAGWRHRSGPGHRQVVLLRRAITTFIPMTSILAQDLTTDRRRLTLIANAA
jgi:hypothetical protein